MARREGFQSRLGDLFKPTLIALIAGVGVGAMARPARAEVDFNKDIRPIFKESCIKCHSLDNPRHKLSADFSLVTREAALKGGENGNGKDIIPGNAKDSILYKLLFGSVTVDGEDIDAMPKKKRGEHWKSLSKEQIELIKHWIDEGAHWGK